MSVNQGDGNNVKKTQTPLNGKRHLTETKKINFTYMKETGIIRNYKMRKTPAVSKKLYMRSNFLRILKNF